MKAEVRLRQGLQALRLEAPEAVVTDLTAQVDAALEEAWENAGKIKLAEFNPEPGVKITVTVPHSTSPEMFRQIAELWEKHFPDNPAILIEEGIEMEADDGSG